MKYLALITALAASPCAAQTFAPETVQSGWQRVSLTTEDIDGTIQIAWTVTAGLGNLTVVCGAWAVDEAALAPYATAGLAKSTASEGDRLLLSSLSHFAQAGGLDALDGATAPCQQTTAVSTGGVSVDIYEGDVLVPAKSPN